MTKGFLLGVVMLLCGLSVHAQAYIGHLKKDANFRSQPSLSGHFIGMLPYGSELFIYEKVAIDGFYEVIDITTNESGFVPVNLVQFDEPLSPNNKGIFSPISSSTRVKPRIKIFNDTSKSLRLELNGEVYTFLPRQKRTIKLTPGLYDYYASASGVRPDYGKEVIDSHYKYEWIFYIRTSKSSRVY